LRTSRKRRVDFWSGSSVRGRTPRKKTRTRRSASVSVDLDVTSAPTYDQLDGVSSRRKIGHRRGESRREDTATNKKTKKTPGHRAGGEAVPRRSEEIQRFRVVRCATEQFIARPSGRSPGRNGRTPLRPARTALAAHSRLRRLILTCSLGRSPSTRAVAELRCCPRSWPRTSAEPTIPRAHCCRYRPC
jgi:hypothetical protein